MSKKTELVEAILKIRKKENDLAESKHLYTLTNQQLEKIYNSESKRTEQEVLKDFENLGYNIKENSNAICILSMNDFQINIRKYSKKYCVSDWDYLDMQEHKLLTELFTIWNWI